MLIGGGGERKTLRIVAEHADIWHSFSDVETLERKLGVLRRWCDTVGRDPDEIEISTEARVSSTMTAEERHALDAQYALGARLFTVGISGPDIDLALVRELLAWRDGVNAR